MKVNTAIAALLGVAHAGGPDVYGPNGEGYSNTAASYDLSRIGISVTEKGTEDKKCAPGDWATVHWAGYLKDGREITNSRAEPGGLPKTFSLGAHEVFSCWDLALTQLHKGDKARLDCPSYFAYGGAFTQSPLGGEPIPLHSDVEFDIEVVDCNRVPEFTAQVTQPHTTTMQPGRCMYIHAEESAQEDTPLVLDCENTYRPTRTYWRRWPIIPCYLDEWVKENKNQEFYYNEDDHSIKDAEREWKLGMQGSLLGLVDYSAIYWWTSRRFSRTPDEWSYESTSQTLETKRWGNTYLAKVYRVKKWQRVYMRPFSDEAAREDAKAKWRLEYCWKNF